MRAVEGFRRTLLTSIAGLAVALVAAAAAFAGGSNAAAYRAQVNAICRSFTPTFTHVESDMAAAKRARDSRRYAYDTGVMLALSLKETVRVEKAPVPSDARQRMAAPLRLLHTVELQLRRTITAAVNADAQAFATESTKLARVAAPLNKIFDAAGLRDCGSNQS
jgi:hypothetical protein